MEIVFLNHTFLYGGGPDRVIFEVAKRLRQKHDITIASFKDNIDIFGTRKSRVYCPNIFGFPTPILTPSALMTLGNSELKNIHYLPFAYFSLFLRKPTVFTFHGWTDVPENERGNKFMFTLREKILKTSGRLTRHCKIVAVSNYLKRIAEKWNSNVSVIPNGVDTKLYNPGGDEEYILYVGRLVKYKGVHELIRAASKVDLPLHIAGSGPELDSLVKLANEFEINDRVKFLGVIAENQLIEQYRHCSFFVSASKWEGFGIPFLEANACGKAVIGYNRAAIPERILNDKNGLLVNNYEELLSSMKTLANDDKKRRKLGSEGRRISENYDWNVIADLYDKLFLQAMA